MSEGLRDLIEARWRLTRAGLLETALKFSDSELTYRPATGLYSVAETLLHVAHEEEIEVRYGVTRTLNEVPPAYDSSLFPTRRLCWPCWRKCISAPRSTCGA